ncbi:hypothetical protein [Mesomycoplasma ovipneumoniae]|nr:hypothetical protein [Mesomycoplasma ovipneumoniae]
MVERSILIYFLENLKNENLKNFLRSQSNSSKPKNFGKKPPKL